MDIDSKTASALAAIAGAAAVWLAWGMVWLHWRLSAPTYRRPVHTREMDFGWWRWGGLGLMAISAGMAALIVLLPEESFKPNDRIPLMFLGAFIGGGCSLTGWILWRSRIRLNLEGVEGLSILGLPRYMAWRDLQRAHYNASMGTIELSGAGKPVYVTVYIDDYAGFLRTLCERAPAAHMDIDMKKTPHELMYASHYEGMEKNAPIFFGIAATVFLITLPFLTPYPPALAFAGAGGACLALPNILRGLLARSWFDKLGAVIMVVPFAGIMLMNNFTYTRHDAHLGGPDVISGGEWMAILVQSLSFMALTTFLLLIAAKRLWPQRFAPSRNRDEP